MARVIVTPDNAPSCRLMDETVNPAHLADEHSSLQVIQRLAWAVSDADDGAPPEPGMPPPGYTPATRAD